MTAYRAIEERGLLSARGKGGSRVRLRGPRAPPDAFRRVIVEVLTDVNLALPCALSPESL